MYTLNDILKQVRTASVKNPLITSLRLEWNRHAVYAAEHSIIDDIFDLLSEVRNLKVRNWLYGLWYDASVRSENGFWDGKVPDISIFQRLRDRVDAESISVEGMAYHIIAKASMQYIEGDWYSANTLYRKAAALHNANHSSLIGQAIGAHTVSSMQDYLRAQSGQETPSWLSEILWVSEPKSDDPLYFVGCDSVYFAAFAADLCKSIDQVESLKNIHFHVSNPIDEIYTIHKKIVSDHSGVDVSLSVGNFDVQDEKAAHTCIRFWRLPEILRRLDRPVIIVDADGILKEPVLSNIVADRRCVAGVNLGFRRFVNYPNVHPWRGVSANCLFIKPQALDFSIGLAKILNYSFDRSGANHWWIDQNALGTAYKMRTKFTNLTSIDVGAYAARGLALFEAKGEKLRAAKESIGLSI